MKTQIEISASQFLEIVNTINKATTLDSLFKSTMDQAPVKMASYHHFPSVGALDYKTLGTYHGYNLPTAIKNHYKAYDMQIADPGLVAVFAKGGFVWLSDLCDEPFVVENNYSEMVKATINLTGEGLCIPLFGPNKRRGYMFVAGDAITKDNGPYLAYQVQALALLFHSRFCMIIQNIQRHINLTKREAEVLELLTYGKTNQDIANILGLSASTVASYMKTIFLKLEVSDRVSASMRAQAIKVTF